MDVQNMLFFCCSIAISTCPFKSGSDSFKYHLNDVRISALLVPDTEPELTGTCFLFRRQSSLRIPCGLSHGTTGRHRLAAKRPPAFTDGSPSSRCCGRSCRSSAKNPASPSNAFTSCSSPSSPTLSSSSRPLCAPVRRWLTPRRWPTRCACCNACEPAVLCRRRCGGWI